MADTVLQCLSAMLITMTSAVLTLHTINKVPSRPGQINMHESQLLTTHVDLSWEASTGYLDSYLVMLKNCAGDVVAKKSTKSTWPTILLDNPLTGTAYEVVIWAVAGGTLGPPMTSKIQVEESNLRIRNLIEKKRGTTYVLLEWTSPLYNSVENYEVQWHPVHSKSVEILKVDPDETSLYIKDLNPGELFTFIVTSVFPSQCEDKVRVQSEDIQVRTLPSRPGQINMHESQLQKTHVDLSWEASTGYVDSYLVILENCAGDVVAKKSTESTWLTLLLDNPLTGTAYAVVIWAVAGGTLSPPMTSKIQVEESNLRIRNLIAKKRGTTYVLLEWTSPLYNSVENYEVQWHPVHSKSVEILKVDPGETSLYIKDLNPGELFTFIVTSVFPSQCEDKVRVQSEDIQVRTLPSRPGQINMHESQLQTTYVDLSWEASTGYVDSYLVILENCAGDVVAKKSTESTWLTLLLDNPLTGTAYEVVIWAVAGGTLSPPMASKIQVEESNLRIRNLIAKKRGTTYVLLEWTSPLYNSVENYEVQWHPVHSKSVEILKVDPDETSLYIKDLNPGELFTFIVTSVFPSQCEDKVRVQSEDIQVRTLPSRPGQINMHESQLLTTHVDLSWEASTGYVDSYLVMLKNCAGDVVAKKSTESTWLTILLENPLTGTAYEVVIWAVAGGRKSPPMTSKIQVEESNLRIRNLIAKKRGTTYVLLEWTSPLYNSVENYEVQWHPVHSKSVEILKVDPGETSLYIKDLNPGQLFTFIVTSVFSSQCEDKVRVQSEDIQVRTLEEPQQPPFIDEQGSKAKSTSIELKTVKTFKDVMKYIIVRERNDNSLVLSLESRDDTVLVNEDIEINTNYIIEIFVKSKGIPSVSQFLHMKTKDVQVSMPCFIGGIVGGTIAIGGLFALGPLLTLLGFGSGGIVGGTIAAWLMSFGNISAGSLFAILQSVGVLGLSVSVKATLIATGIAAGCMIEVT